MRNKSIVMAAIFVFVTVSPFVFSRTATAGSRVAAKRVSVELVTRLDGATLQAGNKQVIQWSVPNTADVSG
jgi:hypothetical protein